MSFFFSPTAVSRAVLKYSDLRKIVVIMLRVFKLHLIRRMKECFLMTSPSHLRVMSPWSIWALAVLIFGSLAVLVLVLVLVWIGCL